MIALLPPVGTAAQRAPAFSKPNILFILVDDMGYGDLSVTGNRKVRTPNIDRLAAEGMLMTDFAVGSPICSPSRVAFTTGHFPARHRIVSYLDSRARNREMGNADWLASSVGTLAKALKGVGYATGHFGKWHMGGGRDVDDAPLPTEYGFDESFTQFEGLGPRVLLTENTGKFAIQSLALGRGPIERAPKADLTRLYVDRLFAFASKSRGRPWFAQLWLDDVHDPFHPTPEQMARVRSTGRDEHEEALFAVLVAMDAEIGRLVTNLRRSGQLDRTLIVLTSDNGPPAGAHYYRNSGQPPGDPGAVRGRKGSLYQGGVRTPLIVRWPGRVPAGSRDATTVASATDLWPTLAALTGAAPPVAPDGVDISSAWLDGPIASRPPLYWAFNDFGTSGKTPTPALERDRSPPYAIRSGRWKLLSQRDGSVAELYDLKNDPAETRNLAAERPDVAGPLIRRLVAWQASLPR